MPNLPPLPTPEQLEAWGALAKRAAESEPFSVGAQRHAGFAIDALLSAYRALREENERLRQRLSDEHYEASMAEMSRATRRNIARRNRENRENGR